MPCQSPPWPIHALLPQLIRNGKQRKYECRGRRSRRKRKRKEERGRGGEEEVGKEAEEKEKRKMTGGGRES